MQLLQQHRVWFQSRHFAILSCTVSMIKISGAYNQLTRILSWRGWRKHDEPLPDEQPERPPEPAAAREQTPKRKKRSIRRLTKMIHKRKTKDSISNERLVTGVEHSGSDETTVSPPPVADPLQTTQVVYHNDRLKTEEGTDEGACAKSANDAEFGGMTLEMAFSPVQEESDDDSLLNSSGNSYLLDVTFNQPSFEVLEEVYSLLTDIARINRDSQVTINR